MKKLLLFILLTTSISAFSQLTITASDFGSIGDTVVYNIDNNFNINIGTPGTGKTWNFSTLSDSLVSETFYFVNPSILPNAAMFPSSNLATVTASNAVSYFNKSSAGVDLLGQTLTVQIFTNTGAYNPPQKILVFPVSYQSNFNSVSNTEFKQYVGIDTTLFGCPIKVDTIQDIRLENYTVTFDAEGQLNMPFSTYSALRAYTVLLSTDSIYIYSPIDNTSNPSCQAFGLTIPQGWSFASSTITQSAGFGNNPRIDTTNTYAWFVANGKLPMVTVQVDGSNNPITGTSFQKVDTTNIAVQDYELSKLIIYPNPASDIIRIQTTEPLEKGVVKIYDMAGRLVKSKILNQQQPLISVSQFKSGSYVVNVVENGRISYVGKFNVAK